jgi:asparagine synthase (glutamine-hydrolysing)
MCGIFGAIDPDLSDDTGRGALSTLRHRGPDGMGSHRDPSGEVFFGHTRLAIIDLSPAGSQPMVSHDGTLMLTMNGEIYNHEELRVGLEGRGHRFRSSCDAEVILHLFEEHGIDLLEHLHGMFAFALYDTKSDSLYLARDRIGIKPAYYYDDGRRFYFASELKAIRAVPGLDLTPDVTAYYDYLTYQFVPAPKTVYRHASKLMPGHYLKRHAGHTEVRRYWDVAFEPNNDLDEPAALEELDELLATVVREHLVSDVQVGILLSAGVDSGLVLAHANRIAEQPLVAFTIGFPERKDDEAAGAAEFASRLRSPQKLRSFSMGEILETEQGLPDLFDEPFADHSAMPMTVLSRLARSGVKVVLSGDGGDETHLGYGRYFKERDRRVAHALADAVPGFEALVGWGPLRGVSWLRSVADGQVGRSVHFHGGIPQATKRMFIDVAAPELRDYDDYWLLRMHDRPQFSPIGRQQYIDLNTYLPEGILTKVDRTSMHFGLEVRPPLLDHRMVEFAARLPDGLKQRGGDSKILLRQLLARRLPSELVYARKRAFSVPIRHFIQNEGMFRLQHDVDVFDAFRIRKDRLEQVLRPSKDSQKLWSLHVLATFLRRHGSR